jgi:DNA-directed RNA polymerase alpha subunit
MTDWKARRDEAFDMKAQGKGAKEICEALGIGRAAYHRNIKIAEAERSRQQAYDSGVGKIPPKERTDDTPISALSLSVRCENAMNIGGIKTIGDARRTPFDDLIKTPNFGLTSIRELFAEIGREMPSGDPVADLKKAHEKIEELERLLKAKD